MIILSSLQYKQGSPITLLNWARMMTQLTARMEIAKGRYLVHDQQGTPIMQFVEALLNQLKDTEVFALQDDFDLYIDHILGASINISKMIDPIIKPYKSKNIFVTKDSIDEIIVPIYGVSNTYLAPFSSWNNWEDIMPIRLLSYDSLELSVPSPDGRMIFLKQPPKYVVVGVDITLLLMKYVHFMRHTNTTYDTVDKAQFISKYVVPIIYDDIFDIWCINLINAGITTFSTKATEGVIPLLAEYNSHITASTIKDALDELNVLLFNITRNNLPIGSLLISKLMGTDTLASHMLYQNNIISADNSSRYLGFNILKASSIIKCLLSILEMSDVPQVYSELIRRVVVDGGRIARSGWSAHIREPVEVAAIKDIVSRMLSLQDQ